MGKVGTGLSMSLDGLIAGLNDGPERSLGGSGERIFKWYFSGDTDYELPSGTMTFKVSPVSAELLREVHATIGALVTGRRTFDIGKRPDWLPDIPDFCRNSSPRSPKGRKEGRTPGIHQCRDAGYWVGARAFRL